MPVWEEVYIFTLQLWESTMHAKGIAIWSWEGTEMKVLVSALKWSWWTNVQKVVNDLDFQID